MHDHKWWCMRCVSLTCMWRWSMSMNMMHVHTCYGFGWCCNASHHRVNLFYLASWCWWVCYYDCLTSTKRTSIKYYTSVTHTRACSREREWQQPHYQSLNEWAMMMNEQHTPHHDTKRFTVYVYAVINHHVTAWACVWELRRSKMMSIEKVRVCDCDGMSECRRDDDECCVGMTSQLK